MPKPVPTSDLTAFLAVMGPLAVISTVVHG
jgi:hypothetical protein